MVRLRFLVPPFVGSNPSAPVVQTRPLSHYKYYCFVWLFAEGRLVVSMNTLHPSSPGLNYRTIYSYFTLKEATTNIIRVFLMERIIIVFHVNSTIIILYKVQYNVSYNNIMSLITI